MSSTDTRESTAGTRVHHAPRDLPSRIRDSRRKSRPLLPVAPPGSSGAGRQPAGDGSKILTTRVGLSIPEGMTFELWEMAGPKIFGLLDSFAWCIGDWLIYGQDRYADRYRRAVQDAGLDYQTLRNYAWIARKFTMARRRAGLSFQHHAEVASLPGAEQDAWLDRAEQAGWSRNMLRRQLKESRSAGTESGNGEESVEGTSTVPAIRVAKSTLDRWREAALRSSIGFEEWMVAVLDAAAAGASVPLSLIHI